MIVKIIVNVNIKELITWRSRAFGCRSCGIDPVSECAMWIKEAVIGPFCRILWISIDILYHHHHNKWKKLYCLQYIVHLTSTGDMMSPFISTATCCGKTERRSLSNFSFSSSISRRAAMQSRVSKNARRCPSSVRLWMNRPTWALTIKKGGQVNVA